VPAEQRFRALDLALIAALGLAVRVSLIAAFPAIHGGDSVVRLAHSDALILAHQLPLPQLLVVVARWLDPDPFGTRLLFAAVGALVPVALALAMLTVFGPTASRIAAVVASVHPLFLHYSTVPYQEGPMLLLLLLGAAALARGRDDWAAAFVGLACLCRYEAWIAAALLAFLRREHPLRAALLFGWAPLSWVVAWRGLSPQGTYVLDLDSLAWHWPRVPYLFAKLREYSGDTVVALALVGGAQVLRRRDRPLVWSAAFLAGFLFLVFTVGPEFPPHTGLISERVAHLPALFLCALSGIGAAALMGDEPGLRTTGPVLRTAIAAVLALSGLGGAWRAAWLAAEANADPSLRLAVDVARFCHVLLPPDGRVAVVAPPIPRADLDDYVAKVGHAGGDEDRAAQWVRELGIRSPDAERLAAHLPRAPRAVLPAGADADLIAVFDGPEHPPPDASGAPIARFLAGLRRAALYRGPCVTPETGRRPPRGSPGTPSSCPGPRGGGTRSAGPWAARPPNCCLG
jgi:hypothetical protein